MHHQYLVMALHMQEVVEVERMLLLVLGLVAQEAVALERQTQPLRALPGQPTQAAVVVEGEFRQAGGLAARAALVK